VGYGDYTARGDLGRALSVLEAMGGQLYLVTVVAVLVSRLSTVGIPSRPAVEPMPETRPVGPTEPSTARVDPD
jgi:hypothetical protein